jgi:hypothetical protein
MKTTPTTATSGRNGHRGWRAAGPLVPATIRAEVSLGRLATLPAEVVLGELGVDTGGLSNEEAAARLAQAGPNQLPQARGPSLELAFLAASEEGHVSTPPREGRAAWPEGAFEHEVEELAGVRALVISLRALKADKAERRDDPIVAAKDRADLATLSTLS